MTDKLTEICNAKRKHVGARKAAMPEAELLRRAEQPAPPRGFVRALDTQQEYRSYGLIAEIKKASPSGGVIRPDFDPAAIALAYESAGAACLSVLTDAPYFQGEDAHLAQARDAVELPVLRKDFMLDPYQIIESRGLGADCVLLIMAALSDAQAKELEAAAHAFSMDALIEVHDEAELDRALEHLASPLIGINHRDLKTLQIDLGLSERLRPRIPPGYTVVGESGIKTHADIERLAAAHVTCYLVGESLLREPDIAAATRRLLGKNDRRANG